MKNNQPEVRFTRFSEDWEERRLGEIYTERKERGHDSLQILSVSIHHGVSDEELDSDKLGKKVLRSEDKSLYKHVYSGDLVLNMMRAWQGAIGVVKSEGMVSPAYITANPSAQIFPLFMDYYFRREEMIAQMNNLSYGVTDFRKRLYWKSFIKVLCHIPTVPEQEKITSFFTYLDKSIATHQQELTIFKQTKLGFLQKIFSQEIRFKNEDGNIGPEWKIFKLGEMVDMYKGKKLGKVDITDEGEYPCILYGELFTTYGETIQNVYKKTNSKEGFLSKAGDILMPTSDVTPEGLATASCLLVDQAQAGGDIIVLRPKNEVDSVFLSYQINYFKKAIIRKVTGTTIKHLYAKDIVELEYRMPTIDEQNKIGSFLSQIDNTIALHQRKLDILIETKKAFLQKMFV